jgi:indole-3-glycerol phosphate synthase
MSTTTILDEILEVKKEEVQKLKQEYSLGSFKEMEFFESKTFKLSEKIKNNKNLSIIAEIKKASPSKGIIREDFNHLKIADIYFEQEVQAVSVLTDEKFFKGNIKFLSEIARIKNAPLLRKDFIIDEYQIFEARAFGADIILLICEALSQNQINELTHAANELNMEVLLELHSKNQIEKIDFGLNKIIGINNRNLEDFSVELKTTAAISKDIPNEVLLVSESGISKKNDINYLKNSTRTNAILVGEHLMKNKDIRSTLIELKDWIDDDRG